MTAREWQRRRWKEQKSKEDCEKTKEWRINILENIWKREDAGRMSWICRLRKVVTMSLGDVTAEDKDTLIINFEFQNIIKIKIKI